MIRCYLIAACYSVAIHILVVLLLFVLFESNPTQRIGYRYIVNAYVVNQPHIISKFEFQKHQLSDSFKSSKHVIPTMIAIHGFKIKSGITSEPNVHNTSINRLKLFGKNEHLLIKLHNQIQQQINENIYNLPRILDSRPVIIQFLLTPQGTLNSVNIIKSSGIKILDNLATKAVTSIQPFYAAKKYLLTATYFRIKFYFE
jgi:TonB family protein